MDINEVANSIVNMKCDDVSFLHDAVNKKLIESIWVTQCVPTLHLETSELYMQLHTQMQSAVEQKEPVGRGPMCCVPKYTL